MSFELHPEALEDLSRGAAVLGTGGGGDPYVGRVFAENAMRLSGKPITVLRIDEVDPDWFIAPVAQMGAPTIGRERIPAGDEAVRALRAIEAHVGRTADALVPVECGGINSMIPILVAAQTGLPVIDADGMGRAFPKLHMKTFAAYGVTGSPAVLAGDSGETVLIDSGSDDFRLERLARATTIQLGGVAHICEYTMSGAELRRVAVPDTLSLAIDIGRSIREARESNASPLEGLASAIARSPYRGPFPIFSGKAVDVARGVENGFTTGRAVLKAPDSELVLDFQNEYLTATLDGRLVCIVPDLLVVLDQDTGEAITTDQLRYGQRVDVIAIGTPDLMRTPEALHAFGPAAFGLSDGFVPVEEMVRATAG